jgi:uncharacterized membrane protein
MSRRRRFELATLEVLLVGSGILHLVAAEPYRRIIPAPLRRWRSELVAVSGLAEIGCALILLVPRTRRVGAYATAILFIAVLPANVQMALNRSPANTSFLSTTNCLLWLRVPLQVPLIRWALSFRYDPHVDKPTTDHS